MNNGSQNGQYQYPPAGQYPPQQPIQMPTPTPLPSQPMPRRSRSHSSVVIAVVMTILFISAGAFGVWAYSNYVKKKTDVQSQIDSAVNDAQKKQADTDAAKFAEEAKKPNSLFVGPDDYGRVTFYYPKTWSVYVATDVVQNGGTYQAYLNPTSVPPLENGQLFALEVKIEPNEVDSVLSAYSSRVKSGQLTSSSITVNGLQGTRLDGQFDSNTRGSAVIFKIRDKTLTIRTDANTFGSDFNNIVQTIKFNQ